MKSNKRRACARGRGQRRRFANPAATLAVLLWFSAGDASAACAPGQWSGISTGFVCTPAPAGYYADGTNLFPCSPGNYADVTGLAACKLAPAGSYVGGSTATAFVPCVVGSYTATPGQSACTPAPAGSYVPTGGASSTIPCSAGTFSTVVSATSASVCQPAPLGKFVGSAGQSVAASCAPGSYADVTGLTACKLAQPGSVVASSGLTAQSPCPAGSYQSLTGQSACVLVPPGSYGPNTGMAIPLTCAAGTFTATSGALACTSAPPGSFVPAQNGTLATPCAPGSYQPLAGQSACTLASPNFFVPGSGAIAQQACPTNYISPAGASACSIIRYSVSYTPTGAGSGTVTSIPTGANCTAACSPAFDIATPVTLVATPAADSLFSGWSGACTGTSPCTLTMDAAKSVTGSFQLKAGIPHLANISTRSSVQTGNDVLIGGFIVQGDAAQTVVVRARGPSLIPFGIANALLDPVLEIYSGQTLIATNDDWQQDPNAAQVQSLGFAPSDPREAAVVLTLAPGAYTAIVRGKNGTTGVGIVEMFAQ